MGLSEFSNVFKIPPYTELGLSDSAQNMFIITCSSRLPKILKKHKYDRIIMICDLR